MANVSSHMGSQRHVSRNNILRDGVYKVYRHANGSSIRKRQMLSDNLSSFWGNGEAKTIRSYSTDTKSSSSGESIVSPTKKTEQGNSKETHVEKKSSDSTNSQKPPIATRKSKRKRKSGKQSPTDIDTQDRTLKFTNQQSNIPTDNKYGDNIQERIYLETNLKRQNILNTLRLFGDKNVGGKNDRTINFSNRDQTPAKESHRTFLKRHSGSSEEAGTCRVKISPQLSRESNRKQDTQVESQKERHNVVLPAVSMFKRKLSRKKNKGKYIAKFRRYAKFFLILIRLWRFHSLRVHDVIRSFTSLNIMTEGEEDGEKKDKVLFDRRIFRADTQARLSQATKRILQKKPSKRTESEIHKVQVALRSYESIAEYPIHMQKKIASKAWYESYTSKRVITREGHVPMCYYFILSGSVIVSMMDEKRNTRKTVTILTRGDSFGELAIINKTRRETTVISKDKLEMFVLADEDFVDIFMMGGLQDPSDPFLSTVSFLQGWPLEILPKHPNKSLFSFFKRSSVLVRDSQLSDWLYIVKSGSVNVMKRLKQVIPDSNKRLTAEVSLPRLTNRSGTFHRIELQAKFDNHLAHVNEYDNFRQRHNALPQLNIETTDEYRELKDHMVKSTLGRGVIPSPILETQSSGKRKHHMDGDRKSSRSLKRLPSFKKNRRAPKFPSKGPFLAKLNGRGSASSETASIVQSTSDDETMSDTIMQASGRARRMSIPDFVQETELAVDKANLHDKVEGEKNVAFVTVQILTRGSVFGMEELVYGKQPSFSLVSNGAECVMINKKFYLENANQSLMTKMREEVYPYPSEDELQHSLSKQVNWNAYRQETLREVVQKSKLRKLDINDAKTRFEAPIKVT